MMPPHATIVLTILLLCVADKRCGQFFRRRG